MISLRELQAICPETTPERLALFVEPINAAFAEFAIDAQAAFLSQYAHETMGLRRLEENLNYSAKRLTQVWPKRFPTLASAAPYAMNPRALANRVYANRMGNGDQKSGDGYRFRGRGLPHLTGRHNYETEGAALGLDLVGEPDLLLQPGPAVRVGATYWIRIDGDRLAADFLELTRTINGGENGLADRYARLGRARNAGMA